MKRKLLPIIILLAVIAVLASCAKNGAEQSARTEDGKIVLTLATCSGQREEWDKLLRTAVSSYNDQASEYRIEIHDYGTLNDTPESDVGITQLRVDITAGNTPDIYDLGGLPSPSLASGGMLEDLYPFLDGAPK